MAKRMRYSVDEALDAELPVIIYMYNAQGQYFDYFRLPHTYMYIYT